MATTTYLTVLWGTPTLRPRVSIDDFEGDEPGAVATVILNDQVVFLATRGLSGLGDRLPVSVRTNFNLASLSKQITAYAIRILEEQGKIATHESLSSYFDQLPSWADEVKIKHLLTHSSGIPDVLGPCRPWGITTNAEILASLRDQPILNFNPGTKYEYCNTGYIILASLVEKVSGMSFSTFVEKKIFDKLGMKSARVLDAFTESTIPQRAIGYNSWPMRFPLDENSCNYVQGDGGIYVDALDYMKWLDEIEEPTLVDGPAFYKALRSGFPTGHDSRYAYGWEVSELDDTLQLEHGGSWLGFRAYVLGLPEKQTWFFVFSNSADTNAEDIVGELMLDYENDLEFSVDPP